jgi:hypothetical protein
LGRGIGAVVLRQQLASELRSPDVIVIVIDTDADRSPAEIRRRAGTAAAEGIFTIVAGTIFVLVFRQGDKTLC